jgi:DNA (cytosine-5)-methyltransferase 1
VNRLRSPRAYYNENDGFAAQWLRNLIKAGHLPKGDVDERSVVDVRPDDLRGYTQCHFFAGISGWSLALQLAGVSPDTALWTGSCPCGPFSDGGKRRGFKDKRHLWPYWFNLIRECRPAICLGEQVASKLAYRWLDLVCADLENEGYAVGSAELGAHSVSAPHKRQRLFFVGHRDHDRQLQIEGRDFPLERSGELALGESSEIGGVGHADGAGSQGHGGLVEEHGAEGRTPAQRFAGPSGRGLGDAQLLGHVAVRELGAAEEKRRMRQPEGPSPLGGFWSDAEWIECRDGKARPIEPGTFPLASRIPARVGRLRGYGNAIVPQVAAAFVRAALSLLE